MIREFVAIGSWVVLVGLALLPESVRRRSPAGHALLTAVAFFVSAALTRYWLRETHSRWQIAAFAAAALALTLPRLLDSRRTSPVPQLLLWAGSASVGVVVVRVALEGLAF